MSGDIQKSGWFRDAYRIKIGDGVHDTAKAGMTAEKLSQLVAKAKVKWPGEQFEFRLIEKRGGLFDKKGSSYLEVLHQKQSTLRKDAKTDYEQPRSRSASLLERDKSRLDAVRLISDKFNIGVYKEAVQTPMEGVQHNAYMLIRQGHVAGQEITDLDASAKSFATDAQRGVNAHLFFQIIDSELSTRAQESVIALDANGALPEISAALPEVHLPSQSLLSDPTIPVIQADEPEQPPQFDPDFFHNNAETDRWADRHQRRVQADVTAPVLNQLNQQAKVSIEQAAQPAQTAPTITPLLLVNGKKALRITQHSPNGEPSVAYFNFDKLQRINAKGAYRPPAPNGKADQALAKLCGKAGISWSATKNLHQGLQRTEQMVREKYGKDSGQGASGNSRLGELWTGQALQQAMVDGTQQIRNDLQLRLASRAENGVFANAAHQDEQLAAIGAQTLMVDLVTTEHLMAVTTDPQAREPLTKLHEQLGSKLLACLKAADADEDGALREMGQHLKEAREAAVKWAGARELKNFPSDVSKIKRLGEKREQQARKRLNEAVERQKNLAEVQRQMHQVRPMLDDARRRIQARAEVAAERAKQARAAGNAAAARKMVNPMYKTQVPPKDLSNSPDWQELCAYTEAVNQLREKGRAGFEGYSGEARIPDEVVAQKFALSSEYDPVVATKIMTTMRQLMESGSNNAKSPLHVYVPGTSMKSPWMQWTPQDISGVNEKSMRVAMSQLLELEFMIAHNASSSPYTAMQLMSLHEQVSGAVITSLKNNVEAKGESVRQWVAGSCKRVAELHKQAQTHIRRPDPLSEATMDRAIALHSQAVDEQMQQRLDRAERQAAQAQNEITELGQAPGALDVGFFPNSDSEALDQLTSHDAGERHAAASYLLRALGNADGLAGIERSQLAENLAAQLLKATQPERENIPAVLRLLAASSTGANSKQLANIEGQKLKQALQAIHADISPNEFNTPSKLFDHGRLVTQAEMKLHVQATVDDQKLAVLFLTKEFDSQASDETVMGQRFAQAAQDHFSKDGESRPLVGLFLVRDLGHWVSLVAERQADGSITCLATDTDAKDSKAPAWINNVRNGLEKAAASGNSDPSQRALKPMRLLTATKSLQEGRAPNACGPLQTRMLKSLQERKPGSKAIDHAKKWIDKDAGLPKDPLALRWQLSAERAELLGAALENGQVAIKEDLLKLDRLQDSFAAKVNYQLSEADRLLSEVRNPEDAQGWEQTQLMAFGHLEMVSELLSQYRLHLGDLQLFDATGEAIDSFHGRSEIAQTELALALHRMRIDTPEGTMAEGLQQWQEVEGQALRSDDASMISQLDKTRKALQQEWGLELLPAEQINEEAALRASRDAEIKTWNSDARENDFQALAAQMLPNLSVHNGRYDADELSAYLKRFPQRTDSLAVLARAASKLAVIRDDDLASQEGWKHQAYQLWSELADNPWSSADLKTEAQTAKEILQPKTEPMEFENPLLNVALTMDEEQISALRTELDEMLRQAGIDPISSAQSEEEIKPDLQKSDSAEVGNELENDRRFDPVGKFEASGRESALVGAMIEVSPISASPALSHDRITRIRQARASVQVMETRLKNQKTDNGLIHPTRPREWITVSQYCGERENAVISAVMNHDSINKIKEKRNFFGKLFMGGDALTLSKFPTLPELASDIDLTQSPRQIWLLGELMLLQKMNDGKTGQRAQQVYTKYLEPTITAILAEPGGSKDPDSLSYRNKEAAKAIQSLYQKWVAPSNVDSLDESVLEIPKIRQVNAADYWN